MPKRIHHGLNPRQIATLTAGAHADGGGLELRVDHKGARRWVVRLKVEGKMTTRGLGAFPAVSLADARKSAASAVKEAKSAAPAPAPERPPVPTFAELAQRVIENNRPTWSNPKHARQWENTLATYAFPVIGPKPVDEIMPDDILAILEPIWAVKPETASRVRQRLEAVLDLAVYRRLRPDNPARRHILRVLPKMDRKKEHHKALHYRDVPAALRKVRLSPSNVLTRLAFEFMVLTAARSGEVRGAEWSEIDWESRRWTVPAVRMKAKREHRVPLSEQALSLLRDSWTLSGSGGLVFPAPRGGALSDMAFNVMLKRLKVPAVPHGFRSSFRDWTAEKSGVGWAVAENALAHNVGNATERAYLRSDMFEERRGLMQDWADYIAS